MLRERISKIFSNKTLYLVISVIAAITLWVYVTNIDNQNMETTIIGINVNFQGVDELMQRGLVIDESYNYSVSLRVLGKRDTVLKLKNTNISVTVDVSDINEAGSYDKLYSVALPSNVNTNDVYILKKTPDYVSVKINQYSTKTVDIKGAFTGTMKEGYQKGNFEFSPGNITVTGPEDVVARISYAWVELDQKDVSRAINQKLAYVFKDKSGYDISMNKLSVNVKTVDVNMPVILVKKVPLTLKFNSGGGADERNLKYSILPQTITLSGDPETLEKITEIPLKTYDIADIYTELNENCEIAIPKGMTNVSEVNKAAVKIEVAGLATKDIKVSNIQVQNVYSAHKATLVTKEIDVTLRGSQSDLDKITADNITAVIDLKELGQSVGRYSVTAKIVVSSSYNVGAIGTYSVVLTLEAT